MQTPPLSLVTLCAEASVARKREFCIHGLIVLLALLFTVSAVAIAAASAAAIATAPTITFDHIPPYGSYDNLTGHVTGVTPADYKVAVYIYISGWWTKPTFAQPFTPINPDGAWTVDITTGGSDQLATQIAAFLIPNSYTPPLLDGDALLPPELAAQSAAHVTITRSSARTITFSGYTWEVRDTPVASGPGPNVFSDDPANVWVDDSGYLHLKIVKRGDTWECSEVINTTPAGYGKHTIIAGSRVDLLDKNAVLGFFSWDTFAPQYNYREIDIEFSRWGEDAGQNSQYVIQPWETSGNQYRFNLNLAGTDSRHQFDWRPDRVLFDSWNASGASLQTWTYTNLTNIPPAGGNIHINLWLMSGLAPSDGQAAEVIIKSYQFTPIPQPYPSYLPSVAR